VKPPIVRYIAPESEDELLAALGDHGDEARLLAGGQSLVPMLNFRLLHPSVLIDLNNVPGLSFIREEAADSRALTIGAMTRQAAIEDSELVSARCGLLGKAVRHVAHRTIRNRGTIGGSLSLAYPAAELPAAMTALGAGLRLRSLRGDRVLAPEEFFLGALETALEPDEVLAAVHLPVLPATAGTAFVEIARRHGDYALAAAAVVLTLDTAGRVGQARLVTTGGTQTPTRCKEAEAALEGAAPTPALLAEAARAAAAEIDPIDDPQIPAAYRRTLIETSARRALLAAQEEATKQHAR